MKVFVDTSAIVAVFDSDDRAHAEAAAIWTDLTAGDAELCTTNYVIVETTALLQRRFGTAAVRRLVGDLLPALEVTFVTPLAHKAALSAVAAGSGKGSPSLVDCSSFEVVRELGIDYVFAFDRHFSSHRYQMCKSS